MVVSTNEQELKEKRDEWHTRLKENVVIVLFTKADGSEREMVCTLRDDLIPHVPIKDEEPEKKYRPGPLGTIACFDIENDGWRSFRLESVISYREIPEQQGPL